MPNDHRDLWEQLDSLTPEEHEVLDLLTFYVRLTLKSFTEAIQLSLYDLRFFKENHRLPTPDEKLEIRPPYRCVNCKATFSSEEAYHDHLASPSNECLTQAALNFGLRYGRPASTLRSGIEESTRENGTSPCPSFLEKGRGDVDR
jgi:hypothetical protein